MNRASNPSSSALNNRLDSLIWLETRDEADFLGVFANVRDPGGIFTPAAPMGDKSSNIA
jgi:hypothetical protein